MNRKDKVTVTEIGDFISHEFGISREKAINIVWAVVGYMIKSILRGQILNLRHFCTMSSTSVPPTKKNGLGKVYYLPERRKMKIVWSRQFLDKLNDKEVKKELKSRDKEYSEDNAELDMGLLESLKNNLGV